MYARIIIFVLFAFIIGFTSESYDLAHARSFTANLKLKIHEPIYITEDLEMNFGVIVQAPGSDDIILNTSNQTSAANGSILQGSPQSAQFTVSGTANAAISISFSGGNFLFGPGQKIKLWQFTHNAGATPTLNGAGALTFNVGAEIALKAAQATGVYSGTYSTTVNYQ